VVQPKFGNQKIVDVDYKENQQDQRAGDTSKPSQRWHLLRFSIKSQNTKWAAKEIINNT
jgi:hypothetical protein